MEKVDAWFKPFMKNVHSQFGEDGILEECLRRLGRSTGGWCVEFGAWDGKYLSNTFNLIQEKSYSAVVIEADPQKFHQLQRTFFNLKRVITKNAWVGIGSEDGLDRLLADTGIPADFDLLSIDVDGMDYHIWDAMQGYRPKIVVIEFNPTIANGFEFVQRADFSVQHGCSVSALVVLGQAKGYELIATTLTNAFFVDRKYFLLFAITDNSVVALRADQSLVTQLFCGYDGTVLLGGNQTLLWHGIRYRTEDVQVLPKFLRKYPDSYGWFGGQLLKLYRRWRAVAVR